MLRAGTTRQYGQALCAPGLSRMTWEELGSIGEIVSAIAVLITLVYLSYQLRTSNRLESAKHLDVHMDRIRDFRMRLAENTELSEIWHKGNSNQNHTVEESERFAHLAYTYIFIWRDAFERARILKGIADPDRYVDGILYWLNLWPGLREYWDETMGKAKGPYPDAVNKRIKSQDA